MDDIPAITTCLWTLQDTIMQAKKALSKTEYTWFRIIAFFCPWMCKDSASGYYFVPEKNQLIGMIASFSVIATIVACADVAICYFVIAPLITSLGLYTLLGNLWTGLIILIIFALLFFGGMRIFSKGYKQK